MEIEPLTPTIGAVVRGVDLSVEPDEHTVQLLCAGRCSTTWSSSSGTRTSTTRAPGLRAEVREPVGPAPRHRLPGHAGGHRARPGQPEGRGCRPVAQRQLVHGRTRPSAPCCGASSSLPAGATPASPAPMPPTRACPTPSVGFVDGLDAVHDITKPMRKALLAGHTNLDLAETQKQWPPVTHPVVLVHPETGRRALYVNRNSTTHIVGLTERQNEVAAPVAVRPVPLARHAVPVPVGARFGRLLGQSVGAALRRRRLHRTPGHAPGHRRLRPGREPAPAPT